MAKRNIRDAAIDASTISGKPLKALIAANVADKTASIDTPGNYVKYVYSDTTTLGVAGIVISMANVNNAGNPIQYGTQLLINFSNGDAYVRGMWDYSRGWTQWVQLARA